MLQPLQELYIGLGRGWSGKLGEWNDRERRMMGKEMGVIMGDITASSKLINVNCVVKMSSE